MQTKQFKAKSLVLVNRVVMKQSILITFLPLNLGGKPSSGALVSLRDPTVWKLLGCQALAGRRRRPARAWHPRSFPPSGSLWKTKSHLRKGNLRRLKGKNVTNIHSLSQKSEVKNCWSKWKFEVLTTSFVSPALHLVSNRLRGTLTITTTTYV